MPQLYDAESGKLIGAITAADLDFLRVQLEEESLADQDYYIDQATLDWFEEQGADQGLVTRLRQAMGSRDGIEIRWAE